MFCKELKGFKALSVREPDGAEIIENLIGIRPKVVIDPVFLLSSEEWITIMSEKKINKPYIFCYFIGDIKGMRDFAKKMHKQLKLPLVVVYKNLRDVLYLNKKMYDTGPKEFLSLIYNAEYVCTNSFHSVCFSAIFQKNFWVFVDENSKLSSKSRIYNIVKKLYLEKRVVSFNNCEVEIDEPIDFSKCNNQIEEEYIKATQYLLTALKD